MAFGPKAKPINELFMGHVKKTSELGCWEWTASLIGSGYGQFQCCINGKRYKYAHRVSWVLSFGEIPSGMFVLHKCDNRICVNPNHLFIGTQKDNVEDMDRKGRRVVLALKCEKHWKSILKAKDIHEIRESNLTNVELATKFGVKPSAISKVRNMRTWNHQQ